MHPTSVPVPPLVPSPPPLNPTPFPSLLSHTSSTSPSKPNQAKSRKPINLFINGRALCSSLLLSRSLGRSLGSLFPPRFLLSSSPFWSCRLGHRAVCGRDLNFGGFWDHGPLVFLLVGPFYESESAAGADGPEGSGANGIFGPSGSIDGGQFGP